MHAFYLRELKGFYVLVLTENCQGVLKNPLPPPSPVCDYKQIFSVLYPANVTSLLLFFHPFILLSISFSKQS